MISNGGFIPLQEIPRVSDPKIENHTSEGKSLGKVPGDLYPPTKTLPTCPVADKRGTTGPRRTKKSHPSAFEVGSRLHRLRLILPRERFSFSFDTYGSSVQTSPPLLYTIPPETPKSLVVPNKGSDENQRTSNQVRKDPSTR